MDMGVRPDLVEAISERLSALDDRYPGRIDEYLNEPVAVGEMADEMTGPLLRRVLQDQMTDELGPYYDTAGLMRRWRVSRQAVSKRHINGSLLALTADDGKIMFPVWQFKPGSDRYPVPIEGIAEIRQVLSERNTDPLSHAIWLTAPVFGRGAEALPAYRLLNDARGAQIVRSAARAEVLRLAEGA